ncbi:altered inheritance rate of mitochondria protein 25 isoform X2 [Rhodamnia argentea]|uniref:Phospholipid scramblase n=1 Tax=Rhodamnia argentea TaxID=178133 RepID=A0A8B8P5J7_9MYRT|nr:altered inheritance rate of mitochondria protein 25 isoform X2 [Rhodamnia argentea]
MVDMGRHKLFAMLNTGIGMRLKYGSGIHQSRLVTERFLVRHLCQLRSGCVIGAHELHRDVSGEYPKSLDLARNVSGGFTVTRGLQASFLSFGRNISTSSHQVRGTPLDESLVDRDFFAQQWVADKKKMKNLKDKGRARLVKRESHGQVADRHSSERLSGDKESGSGGMVLKQPPTSQSVTGYLKPASPEEAYVAPLLARSNLLITRDIEWANLVFGFEQENRYAIVDVCYPQSPVGFIREQSNILARQLLRTRRPFVAYITDAMGKELFRVRRPFWWITSSIYAEVNGKEVGVVHRRWHLWKRVYDLYLGNKQFAVVENPGFWNWTFTLKDIEGKVLAQIDRDWRGFGFEIFTDAGQYVIRFGSSDPISKTGPASVVEELEVDRPLTISERAVALALAISLDNDYFSRHGGWAIPLVVVGE